MSEIEFFTITDNKKSLVALKYWLRKRPDFNSWTQGQVDKNNNAIRPLRWDRDPDSDWGKPQPVHSIIVIKEDSMLEEVERIIKKESK
jgi:hypothetical protein